MTHTFRVQKNTDGADVEEKCLGLDAWVVGDSTNQLNTKRGLHIQIRHNADDATYKAANELCQLLAVAPELLAGIEHMLKTWSPPDVETGIGMFSDDREYDNIRELIKKARGE